MKTSHVWAKNPDTAGARRLEQQGAEIRYALKASLTHGSILPCLKPPRLRQQARNPGQSTHGVFSNRSLHMGMYQQLHTAVELQGQQAEVC